MESSPLLPSFASHSSPSSTFISHHPHNLNNNQSSPRKSRVLTKVKSALRWKSHLVQPRRVSNIIDKHEEQTPAVLMPDIIASSLRHRLAFYFDSSPMGRIWEIIDALINLLFCGVYIWNTTSYNPLPLSDYAVSSSSATTLGYFHARDKVGIAPLQRNLEFLLAALLLFQFLPRIYIAVDIKRFFFSFLCILTLIATVPVFLAYFNLRARSEFMSAGRYAYFYPFRFMRLHLAITACLVPSKTTVFNVSLITRKAIRLLGFLLFLFLTVAAFLHVGTHMSDSVKDVSFFDAFYYAFVSATSGSASQIIPDSPFSRMIIVGVIISAAVFVPTNLAELLRIISNKSAFDHSFKEKSGQNHVVVCGEFEIGSLHTFLKEFFCPDHGTVNVNTHIVILNPSEPSEDLKMILEDPMYMNRVQYVIGTVMNPRSLEKVRIHEANACFVFSSKYATADAAKDDAVTVMRALALKKQVPGLPLHVQVLLPEHKVHFDYLADTIVCVEELKLGMLAQNCRCPGFTTLMHMLTTSITEKNAKSLLSNVSSIHDLDWVTEYLEGANQEIYPTVLSSGFEGMRFTEVSSLIYSQFGAVIIGLGIPNQSYYRKMKLRDRLDDMLAETPEIADSINPDVIRINASDFELYINPGKYEVKGGEIGFLIASDEEVAKKISENCPSDIIEMYEEANRSDYTYIRDLFKSHNGPQRTRSRGLDSIPELLSGLTDEKKKGNNSSKSALRNHRIIPEGKRKDSPHDIHVNVKQLLKNEAGNGDIAILPQTIHDTLVMPSSATPNGIDTLPSSLFDPDTSPGFSDSANTLAHENVRRSEVGLVSRILSQAIGFTSVNHRGSSSSTISDAETSITVVSTSVEYRDHILICDASSDFPSNLEYFIAPLRAPNLKSSEVSDGWTQIVILSLAEPSPSQKHILDQFEKVYIVKGSPIVRKDLLRAGVNRCKKVVVFANSSKGKNMEERTADADALLIVLSIEALSTKRDLFVVTECIHDENMSFIGPSGLDTKAGTKEKLGRVLMRPAFMSGHVYAQSMLDTLICQNYFNPHMLNIVRHMLFSGSFETFDGKDEMMHSHVWLLNLPPSLVDCRYLDLFHYLAKEHDAIPIGLYRNTHIVKQNVKDSSSLLGSMFNGALFDITSLFDADEKRSSSTGEKSKHRYVYLNPEPSTKLKHGDYVYVLSHSQIIFN